MVSNCLKAVIVILGLVLVVSAAWAERPPVILPVPTGVAPQWAPVPQAQGIQYAPNLGVDVFRYGSHCYYWHGDRWYRGRSFAGPWVETPSIPQPFYQIQAPYFKNPPGWSRGRKTGWGGAPMPPGQMKKYEEGPRLPPGQMKKY